MSAFEPLLARLRDHELYGSLRDLRDLRVFMEHHVIAVWDFMSLLKSLQRDLAGDSLPWLPPRDPEGARLINEIVLDEESDEVSPGRFLSHFSWYREAMAEVGCDLGPIDRLLGDLAGGRDLEGALRASGLPEPARRFGLVSAGLLLEPTAVRAAVFLHGREAVIPEMFVEIVRGLEESGVPCASLVAYLERHVVCDAEVHGPRARRLVERLVGDGAPLRRRADEAAARALEARCALWDGILTALGPREAPVAPSSASR